QGLGRCHQPPEGVVLRCRGGGGGAQPAPQRRGALEAVHGVPAAGARVEVAVDRLAQAAVEPARRVLLEPLPVWTTTHVHPAPATTHGPPPPLRRTRGRPAPRRRSRDFSRAGRPIPRGGG